MAARSSAYAFTGSGRTFRRITLCARKPIRFGDAAGRKKFNFSMTKKKAKPAVEDEASRRRRVIKHLEDALRLIKELNDPTTGHLIERALTEARARQFQPLSVA